MSTRLMHVTFSKNFETNKYQYYFRRIMVVGKAFQQQYYFLEREMSAFVNYVMPVDYIQLTWDIVDEGFDEAVKVLVEGLSSKTVPGFPEELGEWEYFTGTARDHVKAIFVPKGLNLTLKDVGLHVDLTPTKTKTLSAKAATAMKRLNRLFAPVDFAIFGEVVDVKGDVFTVRTNDGKTLTIRYMESTQYDDGMNLFSVRGAELMAGLPNARVGDGFRITAISPFKFFKGHAMVANIQYDAILYGGKDEVKYDHFYFGRLSELHVSDPNTDFQSVINFFVPNKGLENLGEVYNVFYQKLINSLISGEHFRKMMLSIIETNPETDWVRAHAARLGMDAVFPGLARADFKMLEPIMDKSRRGVVPMTGFAKRRYIMPSPYIFDEFGNRIPEKDRLRGNVVFSPGVNEGPIAMYRQPNGNFNEHWMTTNVRTPFKDMGRHQIIYLGADVIPEALPIMGGADFDDPVIVIDHPTLVNQFRDLPVYPMVPKVETESTIAPERDLRYVEALQGWTDHKIWSQRHLLAQIASLRSATGIGVYTNAAMLDTLTTLGKESMINDLGDRIEVLASDPESNDLRLDLIDGYEWLEHRPDYLMREIASDLESRIDAVKMLGGGDVDEDAELIKSLYAETRVYPECWTIGGYKGGGRIPASALRMNPLTAKTPLCRMLWSINDQIKVVKDNFIELEWALVMPLPSELTTMFRPTQELRDFVSEIRSWWNTSWEEARESGATATPEGVKEVYARLNENLELGIEDSDFYEQREFIAVELARRIYANPVATAPLDESGDPRHVPDGLLWTKPLGMAFLNALDKAGLTGKVEHVDLYPEVFYLRGQEEPVKIKVGSGIVQRFEDGKVLGTVKLDDGEYTMDHGSIVIRPVHPSLKLRWGKKPDQE